VIERERKQAKQKRQQEQQIHHQGTQPPSEETEVKKLSSPATQTAPPKRITTPVKATK